MAVHVATYIEGSDEGTVIARRNIIRYMVLVQAMVLSKFSLPVKKRYPNLESIKAAGRINYMNDKLSQSNSYCCIIA